MSQPFDPCTIENPDLVRVLASPVRQELVDTLAALGGRATVADLADELGRPADGLYHHMRILLGAGLVQALDDEGGGERAYRLAGSGAPLKLSYRQGATGNVEEVKQFAKALLKIAAADFEAALDRPDVTLHGPRRTVWAARNKGWLSDADIVEVNRLLERLNDLLSQTKAGDRPHLMSFAFSLAPLEPRPKRRGDDTRAADPASPLE